LPHMMPESNLLSTVSLNLLLLCFLIMCRCVQCTTGQTLRSAQKQSTEQR
jgi:hypothetical protein